jgi:hypothetical protein
MGTYLSVLRSEEWLEGPVMSSATTAAMRLGGLMLVGGLLTGGLMAMTTPTQMKRQSDNWREMIGVREPSVSDATIPIYAPPEDLTPVQWQTASQENPYAPSPEQWVDMTTDLMPDAVDDYVPQPAIETLPDEIMDARVTPADAAAPQDKAAAWADAAQAAAADVHSVESATPVADANPSTSPSPTGAT